MPAKVKDFIFRWGVIVWILAVWGFVGHMDFEDEIRVERYQCELDGGTWTETPHEYTCHRATRRAADRPESNPEGA